MLSYLYLNRKDRRNYMYNIPKCQKRRQTNDPISIKIYESDLDIYNQTTYKITLNNNVMISNKYGSTMIDTHICTHL